MSLPQLFDCFNILKNSKSALIKNTILIDFCQETRPELRFTFTGLKTTEFYTMDYTQAYGTRISKTNSYSNQIIKKSRKMQECLR